MIFLTLPELLYVAERTLGPDYAVRDYGLLEAALARPKATAFGKDAYPDLDAKAAALLHSMSHSAQRLITTCDRLGGPLVLVVQEDEGCGNDVAQSPGTAAVAA